ncbi:Odorant receptor 138 [Nylanderia fulva]|uniref:Odorant receptor n=1 Tax=Nylanderia fulva TaxID=613905 RepID=A0A6G1LRA2_9HYME|nr:Odorant receptor 138 [Nylanderia fulva]
MRQPGYCTYFTSMRDSYLLWSGKTNQNLFGISVLIFDMSESSGYKDFVWAVKLNRMNLNMIGIWPTTNKDTMKIFGPDIRVAFTFIVITFGTLIPLICGLTRIWGDLILMVDNVRITLPIIVISAKLVIMRWKQKGTFIINHKRDGEDWIASKVAAERDVMIRQARIAQIFVMFGYFILAMVSVTLIILPTFGIQMRHITNLTDRNKPLPMQTYYFYDTDRSPQFELTFLIQAITVVQSAIIYTSIDSLLGLVILHMCGQLENFKRRIAGLVSSKDFNKALSSSVVTHLRLIRYAKNIESVFTLVLFLLILQFAVVFCLCGFLLLIVLTENESINYSEISFMAIVFVSLLIQAFCYCFGADLITEKCDAVYRTICDLEWYTLEARKARNLILLTLLAKQPFRITAGKVVPLNMSTFVSLLKTSAGYISFFIAMRN